MGLLEEDMSRQLQINEAPHEKASELITELNEVLSTKNPKQKSVLTSENVIGLNRMNAVQHHLETYYGFRVTVWDTLGTDKLELVKSRDGTGITKLIEIVKTLQARMEATLMPMQPGPVDNLMGNKRKGPFG